MKKTYLILTLMTLSAASFGAGAQTLKVKSIERINVEPTTGTFHPVFTPDGGSLILTSEGYDGLSVMNLQTKAIKRLSDARGAGYMPALSADGTVVVAREINPTEQTMSLMSIDLQSAISTPLDQNIAHANTLKLDRGSLTLASDGKIKARSVGSRKIRAAAVARVADIFLTEEDLKLALYVNGVRRVIDPLSTADNDVNYCWSSLSPNKDKIVFVAGKYTYTCNLDGSNLKNIGEIHAPVWYDNEIVIGMNDTDDGHRLVASDIVAVKADGLGRQQLTQSSNELKMFPSVSPDGTKVAYHTTEGKLYIINVEK